MAALSRARAALPPLTGRALVTLLLGGALAAHAAEATMRVLVPLAATVLPDAGAALAPAPMAEGLLGLAAPDAAAGAADLGYALHLAVGLELQPLGYALLGRPLMAMLWPRAPWVATALLYGALMWAAALLLLRQLSMDEGPGIVPVATGLTALWGHLVAALVIGWVWRLRMGR